MSLGAILGLIGAVIAAIVGAWKLHVRAVATAEQRGRLDEIEKHNQVSRAIKLTRDAGVKAILNEGADEARTVETRPVSPIINIEEVEDWIRPPTKDEKPS